MTAGLVKLTVYLTPAAHAALLRAAEYEEISRTDAVNRALLVYAPIATARPGETFRLTDPTGDLRTITVGDDDRAVS